MRSVLTILMASLFFHAAAQPVFISHGTITFERKINSYAILPAFLKKAWKMEEDEIAPRMQRMKEYMKQFQSEHIIMRIEDKKKLLPCYINRKTTTPVFSETFIKP